MTAENSKTVSLCSVSDMQPHGQFTQWVDEWSDEISAFLVDDNIVVISTVCPHFGGEIERSRKNRKHLRCRWHEWEYDIESGRCLTFNIAGCLQRYEFYIDDDMIVVKAP